MKMCIIIDSNDVNELIEEHRYSEDSIIGFEDAIKEIASQEFHKVIKQELLKAMETSEREQKKAIQDSIEAMFDNFSNEYLTKAVNDKVDEMLNKEIVIMNDWGKKDFVGTVEDRIQQKFDQFLKSPVDSNGKILAGSCSHSGENRYANFFIKKTTERYAKTVEKDINETVETLLRELRESVIADVNASFEKMQKETFKDAVEQKLKDAGLL